MSAVGTRLRIDATHQIGRYRSKADMRSGRAATGWGATSRRSAGRRMSSRSDVSVELRQFLLDRS